MTDYVGELQDSINAIPPESKPKSFISQHWGKILWAIVVLWYAISVSHTNVQAFWLSSDFYICCYWIGFVVIFTVTVCQKIQYGWFKTLIAIVLAFFTFGLTSYLLYFLKRKAIRAAKIDYNALANHRQECIAKADELIKTIPALLDQQTQLLKSGSYPTIQLDNPGFILPQNEPLLASGTITLRVYQSETIREDDGGGVGIGFSVQIAKGVTMHTGGITPRKTKTRTEVQIIDCPSTPFAITTKYLYLGSGSSIQRKPRSSVKAFHGGKTNLTIDFYNGDSWIFLIPHPTVAQWIETAILFNPK